MSDNPAINPLTYLLTVRETVAALRVRRTTVYKMLAQQKLASVTIGRRRLILRNSVEALFATACKEGR